MYYLCSHEKRYNTKHYRSDYTVRPLRHSYSHIANLLIGNQIADFHPKSLSAMKRAGNSRAACKYRFRVCFSLYIR